jgi:hypothetical protein
MKDPSSVKHPLQLCPFPGVPTAISYQPGQSCTNERPTFVTKQLPLTYTQSEFTMRTVTLKDLEKSPAQQGKKTGIETLDDHEDDELDKISKHVRERKRKRTKEVSSRAILVVVQDLDGTLTGQQGRWRLPRRG